MTAEVAGQAVKGTCRTNSHVGEVPLGTGRKAEVAGGHEVVAEAGLAESEVEAEGAPFRTGRRHSAELLKVPLQRNTPQSGSVHLPVVIGRAAGETVPIEVAAEAVEGAGLAAGCQRVAEQPSLAAQVAETVSPEVIVSSTAGADRRGLAAATVERTGLAGRSVVVGVGAHLAVGVAHILVSPQVVSLATGTAVKVGGAGRTGQQTSRTLSDVALVIAPKRQAAAGRRAELAEVVGGVAGKTSPGSIAGLAVKGTGVASEGSRVGEEAIRTVSPAPPVAPQVEVRHAGIAHSAVLARCTPLRTP